MLMYHFHTLDQRTQISHTSLLVSKNGIITNGVHYSRIPQRYGGDYCQNTLPYEIIYLIHFITGLQVNY